MATPALAVPLTVGWARDTRDSALAPNSGRFQRANAEWSFAGDVAYLRATYQFQQYVPLSKQFTAAFNAEVGLGRRLWWSNRYPVFKNFYGGGLGSVRGFEQGSLGPRDVSGTVVGGYKQSSISTAKCLAPFPGRWQRPHLAYVRLLWMSAWWVGLMRAWPSMPMRTSLRSSVGVGISWISPVGPLRLAFAKPIRKFDSDKIQTMQFQIGTCF